MPARSAASKAVHRIASTHNKHTHTHTCTHTHTHTHATHTHTQHTHTHTHTHKRRCCATVQDTVPLTAPQKSGGPRRL
jgi:hypothetical protein